MKQVSSRETITYQKALTRWAVQELTLHGPAEGNPFTGQSLRAVFAGKSETVTAEGFYDGEGVYKLRFMPSFAGGYTFTLTASFLAAPLTGAFTVGAARPGNHGPVRVANGVHFAYEDGKPYYSVGTTCYVWALQGEDCIRQTFAALRAARFNKIRFCIFPKHYAYNLGEPCSYPYEGTPMDSIVLTPDNFGEYTGKQAGNHWDFTRFNPAHFRHLEACIAALEAMGVEADLIVMHPYDRWGFSAMSPAQDDLYWHYVVNRFAAYHNVWWSLANEYDLMPHKTESDWERYAAILCACDPYRHLRSIHNCRGFYDYSRPWVTHCSIQRQECYRSADLVDTWRAQYRKPVVMDEMSYEGDLQFGWGNLPAQEMVRRFWETACRGGYPGHGETYRPAPDGDQTIWWSHGGCLRGESWKRFGFLLDVMEQTPGHGLAYLPLKWDCVTAVPECEPFQKVKSYYLLYFSFMQPSLREFYFDDTTEFSVEVIDTWNMTTERQGTAHGKFTVALPGRPYMAVRLRAI